MKGERERVRPSEGSEVRPEGGWVIELNIESSFDKLAHAQLRLRDGVLRRRLGMWLRSGVMEDGRVAFPSAGSRQGEVVLPILTNSLLNKVLARCFEADGMPQLLGRGFHVRFADDAVPCFPTELTRDGYWRL